MAKDEAKKKKELPTCQICGTHRRVIRKYGLNICGRCLREVAEQIGFKKHGI